MLCSSCHVRVRRDFPYCLVCGTLRAGAKVHTFSAPVLQWGDPSRSVAVTAQVTTVGRTDDNDVVIDDPSVSRRHARIVRDVDGFHVEDLDSFNGLVVDGRELRGERKALHDGTRIAVGDVEVTFTQPRPTAVGSRTRVRGTEHTVLRAAAGTAAEAQTAVEPLSVRPEQRGGWALKQVQSVAGEQRWVLRNTRTGQYLCLDEREVFVWEHLDGRHTMRELLFAYLERFGELALPRIEVAVRTFADAELVRGLPDRRPELTGWPRIRAFLIQNLIRVQVSIQNLNTLVDRAYRAFVWRLFTPVAVAVLWMLTAVGVYAFSRASEAQQLFDLAGAGPVGGAVVVAGYLVSTALHEAAHAFAVKSYGRRVNRGGFMVMMGFPFAFVDTSDMWFGTPYSRIVVAVSGPLTTAGIAGAASLTALSVPDPRVAGVCYTLAFGLYINTLFNLIPLMPLDGYQALADALRTPRLREEAKAYLGSGLWRDLRARRRPGPKEIGLMVFAVTSALCLYAMLVLAVVLWNSRLGELLQAHVHQPWRTGLVVVAIALLVFPVWYPLARRVAARRRRTRSEVPGESVAGAA